MKSCIPRLALAETLLLAACSDISPSTIADAVGAPEAEVGAEIQVETPAGNDAEVDGGPGPDVADLSGGPPDVASLDTSPAPPPACRVSVDALPAELNGSTPYAQGGGPLQQFRLRVPTRGFSIDVYALDAASRLATDTVVLHASAGATLKGETWPPGTNLTPQLNCAEAPDPVGWPAEALVVRHCDVPADAFAPLQGLILEARCAGATAIGPPHALTVDVAVLPPALDPFPAPDPWVVVLSRDLFSHTLAAAGDGTYTLTAAYLPAGNGKADLDEALDALGLLGGDAAFNAQVRAAFLAAVRAEAHRMFVLDAAGEPTFTEQAGTVRWYLYDIAKDQVLVEPADIVDSIRCRPDTGRSCQLGEVLLKDIRAKVQRHIKDSYLKKVDAPVGVKPVLRCWMEIHD